MAGAIGSCMKMFAVVFAAVALMVGLGLRHPELALQHYPFPIGGWVYLASVKRFPVFDHTVALEQRHIERWARDGDVVVNACGKCGTTWTLNIVHQLRSYRNKTLHSDFPDINLVAPWPRLRVGPAKTFDDFWNYMESHDDTWWNSSYAYRIWKLTATSADGPPQPQNPTGASAVDLANVKNIVVIRNPAEQIESTLHFMGQINPDALAKYNFYVPVATDLLSANSLVKKLYASGSAAHLHSWAHHLCKPNYFLLHYTDLKREPEKWMRKIAHFIGETDIPEEAWPGIMERVSFNWMKERSDKFLYQLPWFNVTLTKQIVREGNSGGKPTFVTEELKQWLESELRATLPKSIVDYAYNGGEFHGLNDFCKL